MLSARQEVPLLELVNETLARDPEHVGGLRLLVRILWWQRDMEKLQAALERLLEAAQAAEMLEDERYALTQLTRLAPDQSQYFERLRELGGPTEPASSETPSDFQIVGEAGSAFGEFPPAKPVRQWRSLSGTVSPKRQPIRALRLLIWVKYQRPLKTRSRAHSHRAGDERVSGNRF